MAALAADVAALKGAVATGDSAKASRLLSGLKVKLTAFASLPPALAPGPTAAAELAAARDVFEQAVLLSVALRDSAAFERNFAQLLPYYTVARHLLPPSSEEYRLIGLHLLHLLVATRTAAFHSALELLPPAALAAPPVAHAVALEQYVMAGAYNRVLAAAANADPAALWFTDSLAATVRTEAGACAAAAYDTLPLAAAQRLLRLPSPEAAAAFVKEAGWTVRDGVIDFAAAAGTGEPAIPAQAVIGNVLAYAREVERII